MADSGHKWSGILGFAAGLAVGILVVVVGWIAYALLSWGMI